MNWTLEPNTVLIILGIIINTGIVMKQIIKLERRFSKIEYFLHYKLGFDMRKDEPNE